MVSANLNIAIIAHLADNKHSSVNGRPWVQTFANNLKIRLTQLTGKRVDIQEIYPQELSGGAQISKDQEYHVILPVYSKWFLQSEDCIRVTQEIQSKYVSKPSKCIALIRKNIDSSRFPLAISLNNQLDFWSWNEETEKAEGFNPHDPATEKFFWAKLDDCANDIYAFWVQNFQKKKKSKQSPNTNQLTVFLAESSDDISPYRDLLKRELLDKGLRVLPETKLPNQLSDLNASLNKMLSVADFSIHLLGSEYGEIPEGSNRSMVEIQNDISEELLSGEGKPRFVWVPEGIISQDERQRLLIEDAKSSMSNIGSAEVVVSVIEVFKGVVQEQTQRLQYEKENERHNEQIAGDKPSVYIICDFHDKQEIDKLSLEFKTDNCEVLLSAFEENESSLRKSHMDNLKKCDAVLFYYNRANEKWLTTRILEIKRMKAYGRSKDLFHAAVGFGKLKKKEKAAINIQSLPVLDFTKGYKSEEINQWVQNWKHIS